MLIWISLFLAWSVVNGQPTCKNLVSNCINCTHVNYYCPEENVEYIIACPKLTYCKEHYYTICTSIKPERCKNGKAIHDIRPTSNYKSVLNSGTSKNCQIQIPECQDTGRFVVPGSECQKYILCVKHTQGYTSRIFDCPPNSLFNPVKQRCSPVYRCHEVCYANPKKKHRLFNPITDSSPLVTEKTLHYSETNHSLHISKITLNASFAAAGMNNGSVFSEDHSVPKETNMDCVENSKHQHITKCLVEGTFAVKGSQCKNYIECYEEEVGFTQVENVCDDDMTFNPFTKQCSMTYICPNCADEEIENMITTSPPYTTTQDLSNAMVNDISEVVKDCINSKAKERVEYTCSENKRFPVLGSNCVRYIECVQKANKYDLVELKCPKNEYFDPFAGECNTFYVCPICPDSLDEEHPITESPMVFTTVSNNNENETFEVVNASSYIHSNKTSISKTLVFSLAATHIKPIMGKLTTSTTAKGPMVVSKQIQSSIKGFNWSVAVNGSFLSKLMLKNQISSLFPDSNEMFPKKTTRSILSDKTIMVDCVEYNNRSSTVPQCTDNAIYALKGSKCKQYVKCNKIETGYNIEVLTCSNNDYFNPYTQTCVSTYHCPHCLDINKNQVNKHEANQNTSTSPEFKQNVSALSDKSNNLTERNLINPQSSPLLNEYALLDLIEHVIPDIENHNTRKRDTSYWTPSVTGSPKTIFYRPSTTKIITKSQGKLSTVHTHPPRMAPNIDCMEYMEDQFISACIVSGTFAVKGSQCMKYIKCYEGLVGLNREEHICDYNMLFNPYLKQCSSSYVCPSCGRQSTTERIDESLNNFNKSSSNTDVTTEKIYLSEVLKDCLSLNLEKRVKYTCLKDRTSSALGSNCTRYVKCVKKKNKLALLELRCPKNELFDPYAEKCSPAYICPECTDVSNTVYLSTEASAVHTFSKRETIYDGEDLAPFTMTDTTPMDTSSPRAVPPTDELYQLLDDQTKNLYISEPNDNYILTTEGPLEIRRPSKLLDCMGNSSQIPEDHNCTKSGYFPLIGSQCSQYVKCTQEFVGYSKEVFTCMENQHYDPYNDNCTETYACPVCEIETTTQLTTTESHQPVVNVPEEYTEKLKGNGSIANAPNIAKRHSMPHHFALHTKKQNFLDFFNKMANKDPNPNKNQFSSVLKSHPEELVSGYENVNSSQTETVDCLENSKFELISNCMTSGIFPVKGSECKKYMECFVSQTGFLKKEFTCADKMNFDPYINQCSATYECPSCEDNYYAEKFLETTTQVELDNLTSIEPEVNMHMANPVRDCVSLDLENKDYKCIEIGTRAVLGSNCTRYLKCFKKKSKIAMLELRCPKDENFDPDMGKCTPFYACPPCIEPIQATFEVTESAKMVSESLRSESTLEMGPTDPIIITSTEKTVFVPTLKTYVTPVSVPTPTMSIIHTTASSTKHSTPRVIFRSVVTKGFNSRPKSKKNSHSKHRESERSGLITRNFNAMKKYLENINPAKGNHTEISIDCVDSERRLPIKPECKESGIFAVKGSLCKQYVKCIDTNPGYRTLVSACSKNHRFNPYTRYCSSSYECPLCSPNIQQIPVNDTVPESIQVETHVGTTSEKISKPVLSQPDPLKTISKRKTTTFTKELTTQATEKRKFYDMMSYIDPNKYSHKNRVFSVRKSHMPTTVISSYATTEPETSTTEGLMEQISPNPKSDVFSVPNRYFTPRPKINKYDRTSNAYYDKPIRTVQGSQKPGFKMLALSTAARRIKPVKDRYQGTRRPVIGSRYRPFNSRFKPKIGAETSTKPTTEYPEQSTSYSTTTVGSNEDLQNDIIDCLGSSTTLSRVFQCNDNGIFAVKGSECRQFIKCNKTGSGYSMEVSKCPDNQNFDPNIQLCTNSYVCPQCKSANDGTSDNETTSSEVQNMSEHSNDKTPSVIYTTPHTLKIVPRTDLMSNRRQRPKPSNEGHALYDLINRMNPKMQKHSTRKRETVTSKIPTFLTSTDSSVSGTKKSIKVVKTKRPTNSTKRFRPTAKVYDPKQIFKKASAVKKVTNNQTETTTVQKELIKQNPVGLASNMDCMEYSKYHENIIKCESEGVFAVKGSECKKYIICYEEKMGFTRIERTCNSKTNFNPITQQCSASYECPRCGEQDMIETYTVTKSPTVSSSAFRRLNSVTGKPIIPTSIRRSKPPIHQLPITKGSDLFAAYTKFLSKSFSKATVATPGFNSMQNVFIREDGTKIFVDCVNSTQRNPKVPQCTGIGIFAVIGSHCTQYVNCSKDYSGYHIEVLSCPEHQFFHPVLKTCTYLYECPYCVFDDAEDIDAFTSPLHVPIKASTEDYTLSAWNRLSDILFRNSSPPNRKPTQDERRGTAFFTFTRHGSERERHSTRKRSASGFETYVFPTTNRRTLNARGRIPPPNENRSTFRSVKIPSSSEKTIFEPPMFNNYFTSDLMTKILKPSSVRSTEKSIITSRPIVKDPAITVTKTLAPTNEQSEIIIDCIENDYRNPSIPQCEDTGVYAIKGSHCKQFVECTKDHEGYNIKVSSCPENQYFHPYFKWCLYTYKCPLCSAVDQEMQNKTADMDKIEDLDLTTEIYDNFMNDTMNNEEEYSFEYIDPDLLDQTSPRERPSFVPVDCIDQINKKKSAPFCKETGTFALKGSKCKQYFKCSKSISGYSIEVSTCPQKLLFHPHVKKCTRFYECPDCQTANMTEPSVEVDVKWVNVKNPTEETPSIYSTYNHIPQQVSQSSFVSFLNKNGTFDSDESSESSEERKTPLWSLGMKSVNKQYTAQNRGYAFYDLDKFMPSTTESHATIKRAIYTSDRYLPYIKKKYGNSVADKYYTPTDSGTIPTPLIRSENPEISRLAYDVSRLRSIVLAMLAKSSTEYVDTSETRSYAPFPERTMPDRTEDFRLSTGRSLHGRYSTPNCGQKGQYRNGCTDSYRSKSPPPTFIRLDPSPQCPLAGNKKGKSGTTVIKCTIKNKPADFKRRKSPKMKVPKSSRFKPEYTTPGKRRSPSVLKKRFTSNARSLGTTPYKNRKWKSTYPPRYVRTSRGPVVKNNYDTTQFKRRSKTIKKVTRPIKKMTSIYRTSKFPTSSTRKRSVENLQDRTEKLYSVPLETTRLEPVQDLFTTDIETKSTPYYQPTSNIPKMPVVAKRSSSVITEHVTLPVINKYSVFHMRSKTKTVDDESRPESVFTFPVKQFLEATPKDSLSAPSNTRTTGVGNFLVTTRKNSIKFKIGPALSDIKRGTYLVSLPALNYRAKVTKKRSTSLKDELLASLDYKSNIKKTEDQSEDHTDLSAVEPTTYSFKSYTINIVGIKNKTAKPFVRKSEAEIGNPTEPFFYASTVGKRRRTTDSSTIMPEGDTIYVTDVPLVSSTKALHSTDDYSDSEEDEYDSSELDHTTVRYRKATKRTSGLSRLGTVHEVNILPTSTVRTTPKPIRRPSYYFHMSTQKYYTTAATKRTLPLPEVKTTPISFIYATSTRRTSPTTRIVESNDENEEDEDGTATTTLFQKYKSPLKVFKSSGSDFTTEMTITTVRPIMPTTNKINRNYFSSTGRPDVNNENKITTEQYYNERNTKRTKIKTTTLADEDETETLPYERKGFGRTENYKISRTTIDNFHTTQTLDDFLPATMDSNQETSTMTNKKFTSEDDLGTAMRTNVGSHEEDDFSPPLILKKGLSRDLQKAHEVVTVTTQLMEDYLSPDTETLKPTKSIRQGTTDPDDSTDVLQATTVIYGITPGSNKKSLAHDDDDYSPPVVQISPRLTFTTKRYDILQGDRTATVNPRKTPLIDDFSAPVRKAPRRRRPRPGQKRRKSTTPKIKLTPAVRKRSTVTQNPMDDCDDRLTRAPKRKTNSSRPATKTQCTTGTIKRKCSNKQTTEASSCWHTKSDDADYYYTEERTRTKVPQDKHLSTVVKKRSTLRSGRTTVAMSKDKDLTIQPTTRRTTKRRGGKYTVVWRRSTITTNSRSSPTKNLLSSVSTKDKKGKTHYDLRYSTLPMRASYTKLPKKGGSGDVAKNGSNVSSGRPAGDGGDTGARGDNETGGTGGYGEGTRGAAGTGGNVGGSGGGAGTGGIEKGPGSSGSGSAGGSGPAADGMSGGGGGSAGGSGHAGDGVPGRGAQSGSGSGPGAGGGSGTGSRPGDGVGSAGGSGHAGGVVPSEGGGSRGGSGPGAGGGSGGGSGPGRDGGPVQGGGSAGGSGHAGDFVPSGGDKSGGGSVPGVGGGFGGSSGPDSPGGPGRGDGSAGGSGHSGGVVPGRGGKSGDGSGSGVGGGGGGPGRDGGPGVGGGGGGPGRDGGPGRGGGSRGGGGSAGGSGHAGDGVPGRGGQSGSGSGPGADGGSGGGSRPGDGGGSGGADGTVVDREPVTERPNKTYEFSTRGAVDILGVETTETYINFTTVKTTTESVKPTPTFHDDHDLHDAMRKHLEEHGTKTTTEIDLGTNTVSTSQNILPQQLCTKNGRFPLPGSYCQGYVECIMNSTYTSEKIHSCPENTLFDPIEQKCTDTYVCPEKCADENCTAEQLAATQTWGTVGFVGNPSQYRLSTAGMSTFRPYQRLPQTTRRYLTITTTEGSVMNDAKWKSFKNRDKMIYSSCVSLLCSGKPNCDKSRCLPYAKVNQ